MIKVSCVNYVCENLLIQSEITQQFCVTLQGIKNQKDNRYYRYDEKLIVPIIENTCFECDLEESMAEAMEKYPQTTAVIVRRHGFYVWGDTWQEAKTQ